MAEFIIIFFLVICHVIAGISMVTTRNYSGDLEGFPLKLGNETVLSILLIIILGYILVLFTYRITANRKIKIFANYNVLVNKNRFSYLFLIATIAQILFFLKTGVGKVGGDATSSVSFIFAMFNVSCLFGLFYFICRTETNRFLYVLNILLFCTLQLLKGWSGFLLSIFFFEIYFYFKRNPVKSFLNYFRVLTFPMIAILIGGKIYQYLHAYKNLIRFNAEIENSYSEGITLLLSRLSFFPVAVGAFQNTDKINKLYYYSYIPLRDIQALFRPLAPGILMPNKDFRIIGNLVIQSFHPEVSSATSSNFGVLSYIGVLIQVNFIEFIFYIFISIILLILVKSFFDTIESKKGELNFLYFILLLNIYEVGSLEMIYGYGILPIIFFFPIFIFFGIVKFSKKQQFNL